MVIDEGSDICSAIIAET